MHSEKVISIWNICLVPNEDSRDRKIKGDATVFQKAPRLLLQKQFEDIPL